MRAGIASNTPAELYETKPFPEIADEGPPRFEGEAIAHPLLPAGRAVANDLTLSAERPIFVVSGSNMSGKSTLLACLSRLYNPPRGTVWVNGDDLLDVDFLKGKDFGSVVRW